MKRLKLMAIGTVIAISLVACADNKQISDTKTTDNKSVSANHVDDKMTGEKDDVKKEGMPDEKSMKEDKDDKMKKDDKDSMKKEDMSGDKSMNEHKDDKMMDNSKDSMKKENMSDDKSMKENKDDKMMDKKDDMNVAKTSAKSSPEKDEKMKMDNKKEVSKSVEKMNEGDMAPDFSLNDRDGNNFTLSKQTGKKVYIKFWASWCSACLAGLEELNEFAGEDNDFEIISIVAPGMSGEKNKEDFLQWFDSLGYKNIKILFDETGETMMKYGIRAFPTSAVVGSDGVLVGVQPGHISSDIIKDVMKDVK